MSLPPLRDSPLWVLLFALAMGASGCFWPTRIVTHPEVAVGVVDAASGAPIEGAKVVIAQHPGYPPFGREVTRAHTNAEGEARFEPHSYINWIFFMHGPSTGRFYVGASAPGHLTGLAPVEDPFVHSQVRIALVKTPPDATATEPRHADELVGVAQSAEYRRERPPGFSGTCPVAWSEPSVHREGNVVVGPARVRSVTRRHDAEEFGIAVYQERIEVELEGLPPYAADIDFVTRVKAGDSVWACVREADEYDPTLLLFIAPWHS